MDSDNKAGLKGKYEVRQLTDEVAKLMRLNAMINEAIATPGLTDSQKQDLYVTQANLAQFRSDRQASLAALNNAIEAAPESAKAAQLKSNVARIEQTIKNEEAVVNLKSELAKAEGQDRLKLLDEMVTAYAKLGNRIDGKDESAAVAKWTEEIIKLDADNKAGLKVKYEYQSYLNATQKLLVARKPKEAQAMIEKALALSDLKPQQVSRATYMKCNCLLMQKEYQAAIDCAKTAQESATGTDAIILKMVIQQAEKAAESREIGQ